MAITVNDESRTSTPVADLEGFASGFYTYVDGSGPLDIRLVMTLRGSEELRLLPTGHEVTSQMSGTWPHPNVHGRFLPTLLLLLGLAALMWNTRRLAAAPGP